MQREHFGPALDRLNEIGAMLQQGTTRYSAPDKKPESRMVIGFAGILMSAIRRARNLIPPRDTP